MQRYTRIPNLKDTWGLWLSSVILWQKTKQLRRLLASPRVMQQETPELQCSFKKTTLSKHNVLFCKFIHCTCYVGLQHTMLCLGRETASHRKRKQLRTKWEALMNTLNYFEIPGREELCKVKVRPPRGVNNNWLISSHYILFCYQISSVLTEVCFQIICIKKTQYNVEVYRRFVAFKMPLLLYTGSESTQSDNTEPGRFALLEEVSRDVRETISTNKQRCSIKGDRSKW